MTYLKKLPNSRREPPGLEWVVLRKMPMALLGGTAVPAMFVIASHLFPPAGSVADVARHLSMAHILAIAAVVTVWTAAFTVSIGCFVVVLMKGPAYVADEYPMEDADEPRRNRQV